LSTYKESAINNLKDPLFFINKILNVKLWSKQREIVESVWQNKRTTVKASHGVGKTAVSGNILLAFLYTHYPSIVISTAPTWRQVEKLLWKEVRASYNKSTIPLGGSLAPKSPELQIIQDQWYAMGLSTDDPDKFQGFHERNVLIIVDEAAGVSSKIFEGIEGILSSENAHLLMIGNPTNTTGEFYKSFQDKSYNRISISAFDTPNFKQTGITEEDIANGDWLDKYTYTLNKKGGLVAPYMVTPEWVADKYVRWKPGSILYESKVRANFPNQSEDSLIPVSWIDAAMQRWDDIPDDESEIRKMGVDVSEGSGDATVIAKRYGRKIKELIVISGIDEMKITAHMRLHYFKDDIEVANIDGVGIGHSVVMRAKEMGLNAVSVKGSFSPCGDDEDENIKELFFNLRAQMYWNLRELLNPNRIVNPFPIALPRDEMLMQELSEVRWKPVNGKIQIEDKKDIRKRLGRSPDRADAVVLAFAPNEWLDEEEANEPSIFIIK
jgi:phage terminase large subunit